MNDLLLYATPVALAALGETVSQRAGVINIGLEGMMLTGAFVALVVTVATGNPALGLLAGGLSGVLLALFQSIFTLRLAQDQIVVGTALNLLLLGLTSALYRRQYGSSGALLSLPTLPRFGGIDVGIAIGLIMVPATWWLLTKTRFGLALRGSGEYPPAVEAAGFSVLRLRTLAVAFGGLMGGLAGAYLCVGPSGSFAEEMTKGYGFVAIAMVTFGRWKPLGVYLACLLIGYLEGLQFQFQALGIKAPAELFLALPYLIALVVLAAVGRGGHAPRALAVTYKRGAE